MGADTSVGGEAAEPGAAEVGAADAGARVGAGAAAEVADGVQPGRDGRRRDRARLPPLSPWTKAKWAVGLLLAALALRRTLPFLLLALAAGAAWTLRRARYWRQRGVPGPAPAPLVGNLWPMLRLRLSPGQFVQRLYRSHPQAPYVGFFVFGKPCLLLRDLEMVKRVLVKDFDVFSSRHATSSTAVDPHGATNLFAARGATWAFTRRALSPCFTGVKLRHMFNELHEHCEAFADFVQEHSADPGVPLKVKEPVSRSCTDATASCFFSLRSRSLRDRADVVRHYGRQSFDFTLGRAFEILCLFFVPALITLSHSHFFSKNSTAFFEPLFKKLMQERRRRKARVSDTFDDILTVKDKARALAGRNVGPKLPQIVHTDDHLVAQAMVFFMAGVEPPSIILNAAFFHLARNQPAQTRLREELAATLQRHGAVTYDALADMHYLHMVVMEALRMYPPLPYVDRVCAREYTLPTGLVLEKGTPVFLPMMALQRDSALFPDGDAFVPERWAADPPPPAMLSFGGGPRTCIGMRYALIHVKLMLTSVLHRFRVLPCADTPDTLRITPRGLFLKFYTSIPLRFVHEPLPGAGGEPGARAADAEAVAHAAPARTTPALVATVAA